MQHCNTLPLKVTLRHCLYILQHKYGSRQSLRLIKHNLCKIWCNFELIIVPWCFNSFTGQQDKQTFFFFLFCHEGILMWGFLQPQHVKKYTEMLMFCVLSADVFFVCMSDSVCCWCDMILSGSLLWRCFLWSHQPQDWHLLALPCYLPTFQFLFYQDLFHILLHIVICFLWVAEIDEILAAVPVKLVFSLLHIDLCNPEISWVQASLDWAVGLACSCRRPSGSCRICTSVSDVATISVNVSQKYCNRCSY